jgi:hypothetical protein
MKSSLFSATLMRDKYLLHIINEIVYMIGPFKDLIYTYEYRHDSLSYL